MGHSGQTPGDNVRFPGYDVLGQVGTWDEVTKGVVLRRLGPPPPNRFFSAQEEATARALTDRLLGQDEEPKVPVLEIVDGRLTEKQFDGFRYEDMPEDDEAWRRSVAALDEEALAQYGKKFAELEPEIQNDMLEGVRTARNWHGLPRIWELWMRYCLAAFYAHPWAWNEIGFGGPAYPRGYKNIGVDALEPWEERESHPRDPVPWAQRVEQARRLRQ